MAPRVLILTAAYGDGHKAAASGVARAVWELEPDALVEIADLFAEVSPALNRMFRFGYRSVTTFSPRVWRWFYDAAAADALSGLTRLITAPLRVQLARKLARVSPDVVVSTYPIYPSLLARVFGGKHGGPERPRPRCTTVITDSITVHPLWLQGITDQFFVTDAATGEALTRAGVSRSAVAVTGFPVDGEIPRSTANPPAPGAPPRVLFFPTRSRDDVIAELRTLARATGPKGRITVVLGRHDRRLRPQLEEEVEALGHGGVTLLGWVPEAWRLMPQHDLVVAKAGGATVHEALACATPILIDKVVPGQEEGNAELVESSGAGWVAARDPAGFESAVRRALDAGELRSARAALATLPSNGAALSIARDLLRSGNAAIKPAEATSAKTP